MSSPASRASARLPRTAPGSIQKEEAPWEQEAATWEVATWEQEAATWEQEAATWEAATWELEAATWEAATREMEEEEGGALEQEEEAWEQELVGASQARGQCPPLRPLDAWQHARGARQPFARKSVGCDGGRFLSQ